MKPIPDSILDTLTAQCGTSRTALAFLGGGREDSDGTAYTYAHSLGERVLKVLPVNLDDPASLLPILERLKFVHYLGEQGVRIVYPLALPSGDLLTLAGSGPEGYLAYTMPRARGKTPEPQQWSPAFARLHGQMVGQTHRVTQAYPTWQCSVIDGQQVLGWEQEWQGFYDICADPDVKSYWLTLRKRLSALPQTRQTFGFTHNDPHVQNLLLDGEPGAGGTLTLLDFDVANYHWFINDVMIAMQHLLFAQTGGIERPLQDAAPLRAWLADFMAGYETENHLDPWWLGQLNLFIAYRRALLFTVMHDWLQTQPDTCAQWKEMTLTEPEIL